MWQASWPTPEPEHGRLCSPGRVPVGSAFAGSAVTARRGRSLDPRITWRLDPEDMKVLVRALWVLTEMFFAAGAEKIIPGVLRFPYQLDSLEEAELLRTRRIRAEDLVFGGNHAFCTTRMHGDPQCGVVDEDGRCHDFDNLWIVDTGIFPRCPSVNPMWTGMALAHRAALCRPADRPTPAGPYR